MSVITLTTDFGTADWFVGTMKGVIAGIEPTANVIDLTHDLPPGDIPGDVGQMLKKIASLWALDLELPAGTPRTYSVQLTAAGREIQYRTRFTLAARGKEPKS